MARRSRSKESKTAASEVAAAHTETRPETDWQFIEELLESDLIRTMLIFGRYGSGKTYCAISKGRRAEYVVTLTPETCAAELRGTWIPCGDRFEFHDGPFTAAMREGKRIVINEISHASDDVLAILYAVLESAETARLTLPTRETVRPAPGFQVVATDNRDPSELPPALRDRFDVMVRADQPHPDALARLSEKLRTAASRSMTLEDDRAVSIRRWLTFDRLQQAFGAEKAARAVFGASRGAQLLDALALGQEELAF